MRAAVRHGSRTECLRSIAEVSHPVIIAYLSTIGQFLRHFKHTEETSFNPVPYPLLPSIFPFYDGSTF